MFDIETESWDRFVLGGVLVGGTYLEFTHRQERRFVEALLSMGGHIWTWNGGLFDSLWLLQHLRKMGLRVRCIMAGTRVIRLECDGLVVNDAIALCPMSLAKAARIAGIELDKNTGLECRCGNSCGGYCAIRRSMTSDEYRRLGAYLEKDCRATLAIMESLLAEAARCEYLLSQTVGSTSYKNAARICGIEKADWNWRLYSFARDSYFGGRVEVYKPQSTIGFAYDINSAYPAALTRVELPIGDSVFCGGERAVKAYKRQRPGAYLASVNVPTRLHVPPLPTRSPKGRVIFPTGRFRGVWTLPELLSAEECGVDIQIHRGLVWSDAELVLAPFMNHGWAARERAKQEGNDSLAAWHKWILNSCTGKFAEAPDKERVIINPLDDEVKVCNCGKPRKWCRCRAWRPLDQEGEIWSAPYWRIPSNGHVHWAAYLTAATRIELRAQLVADGRDGRTALYCDTDSVYASTPRERSIGQGLGEWKFEGRVDGWLALAPKVYRYESGGKVTVRGKGLPGLDAVSFEKFRQGEPVVVERGVRGLRSAARGSTELFTRKRLERRNHADGRHFGGRVLGIDGLTHPVTFGEFCKWEKEH